MANEKSPEGAREQLTIRPTVKMNEYIKNKSLEIGTSQNSFVMILLDLGMRAYESEIIRHCQD